VPLELAGSRDDVEIDLPAPALVRGRVVEAGTGEPIGGAILSFEAAAPGEEPSFPRQGNAGESNPDGSWSVNAPPGRYRVVASKEDYAPGEAQVEVTGDTPPPEVRIALSPAAGLTLEVVGPGGFYPVRVYAALIDGAGRAVVAASFPTGEEGRVRLSQAPPGAFTALVKADGSATMSLPVTVPGRAPRLLLAPPAVLTVEVPALANDAQGGKLTVSGADGQPFRSVGWGGTVRQEWGLGGGKAQIDDLPPGSYTGDDALRQELPGDGGGGGRAGDQGAGVGSEAAGRGGEVSCPGKPGGEPIESSLLAAY
jgi:hypothetical protein